MGWKATPSAGSAGTGPEQRGTLRSPSPPAQTPETGRGGVQPVALDVPNISSRVTGWRLRSLMID